MSCPHDANASTHCLSQHMPDVSLCDDCGDEFAEWHIQRGHEHDQAVAPLRLANATTPVPCPGFTPPGNRLAPFRPGEDEIADKTRSTLGRLFGGDIE